MLAEPKLQGFAERIANDLPDDLAMLNEVRIPTPTPDLKPDLIVTADHIDEMDGAALGRTGQAIEPGATNIISLAGFATEPAFLSITGSSC